MDEKTLVVQHNKIVEARYKLTVSEQRLMKVLISKIKKEDEDFKQYEFFVSDIAVLLNLKTKNFYKEVKKTTYSIIRKVLWIKEEGVEIQAGIMSSAKYFDKEGKVLLSFDPVLKPYFLQLQKEYTSYELGNVLRLGSSYAIRIYELCKQYELIGWREFTPNELRRLLGIENKYKTFYDLRRRILEVAKKELVKTDIKFDYEEIKRGRKVVNIRFIIKKRKRSQEEKIQPIDNHSVALLSNLGVTYVVAIELAGEFSDEQIKNAVEYTEQQEKEGKIREGGKSGFLVSAIRGGYRNSKIEEVEQKSIAKKEEGRRAKERAKQKNKEESIEREYNTEIEKITDEHLNSLTVEEAEKVWQSFLKKQEPLMQKKFDVNRESPMAQGTFRSFIRSGFEFPSFEEWKMNKNEPALAVL